eukprot:scaffold1008_cov169-Prasinococcus_capsulatus_cf.AAC.2
MPQSARSCCPPAGRDVFHNPVIAADGKTYDFKYIREWLRVRQVSPLTNMSMAHYNLVCYAADLAF